MELTNLLFAIIGHVFASVLYLVRKFSNDSPKTLVDSSSILEHKEEIKQLWESRMMTNEETANLCNDSKKKEEEDIKTTVHQNGDAKASVHQNGDAKTPVHQNGDAPKISNGTVHSENHESHDNLKISEDSDKAKVSESPASENTDESKQPSLDIEKEEKEIEREEVGPVESKDVEPTETKESPEPEIVATTVETEVTKTEEIVYTSTTTLQQTLVETKIEQVEVVQESEAITSKVESVETTSTAATIKVEDGQDDFEELERRIEAEESQKQQTEEVVVEKETIKEEAPEPIAVEVTLAPDVELPAKDEIDHEADVSKTDEEEEEQPSLSDNVELADSLEDEPHGKGDELNEAVMLENSEIKVEQTGILMNGVAEDDVYRPLADFLPPSDDNIEEDIATSETAFTQNGESEEKTFDDHFVLDTRELVSPASDTDKKDSSDKKSRIHTLGVQKTEQPYSTCTTETKIAMEIREMREREEELKLMRERQAQISPAPALQKHLVATSPTPKAVRSTPSPKPTSPVGYTAPGSLSSKISTPGYRVSSVFGHRAVAQQAKDESKYNRNFVNKESPVEKEIRLAKDREEELRRQKGLPPREDDSYVKPSQVKSSQSKVFGKISNAETSRLLATAKIQHEIEEQTQREMALRESGHIQTLSTERTDAKVTKLKTVDLSPECLSPTFQNGNSVTHTNGTFSNGHVSPDQGGYRRSSPSPTGSNYSSASHTITRNVVPPNTKGISMQKFIASRGKETAFSSARTGPFSSPRSPDYDVAARTVIPDPGKLKRTVSVESKIQQEIMEMKMREEELKKLHSGHVDKTAENGDEYHSIPSSPREFTNGQSGDLENGCPRRNNLIAQWEQRIQNAEGRA